jgi:hypothetical protein
MTYIVGVIMRFRGLAGKAARYECKELIPLQSPDLMVQLHGNREHALAAKVHAVTDIEDCRCAIVLSHCVTSIPLSRRVGTATINNDDYHERKGLIMLHRTITTFAIVGLLGTIANPTAIAAQKDSGSPSGAPSAIQSAPPPAQMWRFARSRRDDAGSVISCTAPGPHQKSNYKSHDIVGRFLPEMPRD